MNEKMQDLVDELNTASEAYYNGKEEILSDLEWDEKFDELSRLEQETGIVLPDSPTQKVSYEGNQAQDGFTKVEHEYPCLSLAKSKDVADLKKWAKNKPVYLSWKEDGASLICTWDNGNLTRVETRGDGHIGNDITYLASAINDVPKKIKYTGHCIVRGEALIGLNDFEEYNAVHGGYSNCRNLVAGSLSVKLDELPEIKKRKIHWVVYNLIHHDADGTPDELSNWVDRMEFLRQNGFNVVPYENVAYSDIDDKVAEWFSKMSEYEFPTDGLVAVHEKWTALDKSQSTQHHFLSEGWAIKPEQVEYSTTLTDIQWQVSANSINPVAVFEPVEIDGAVITRASLANIDEMSRLGLGGVNSKIEIIRANMVIPKVVACTEKVGEFEIPTECPVCSGDVEIVENKDTGSHKLICMNPDCPGKKIAIYSRFVSKDGMDIDGLSTKTIERFINKGWIKTYADFYFLKNHKKEMMQMDGWGEKSVNKALRSIEKSRKVDAQHLLYSLSIPFIGKDVTKKILAKFEWDELIVGLMHQNIHRGQISKLDGIGDIKAKALIDWFKVTENQQAVARLLPELDVEVQEKSAGGDKCKGLTFCITGDVHHYKNRKELQAYIESQGGKVVGSVSKKTSFLINNDVESASSKNQKAKALNVAIISEDEFIKRFG